MVLMTKLMEGLQVLAAEFKGFRDEMRHELGVIKGELAEVKSGVSDLKTEVAMLRSEMRDGFQRVDDSAYHLREKWFEHDSEIARLKRRLR